MNKKIILFLGFMSIIPPAYAYINIPGPETSFSFYPLLGPIISLLIIILAFLIKPFMRMIRGQRKNKKKK